MRYIISTIVLGIAGGLLASASPLSPEAALQRAGSSYPAKKAGISFNQLVYTHKADELSAPGAYVFSRPGQTGFMILSADDRAVPVLGYSDTGVFDPYNIPPALQYMLDCYSLEIADAPQSEYREMSRPQREAIAPLLKTTWDQGYPYNIYCPRISWMETLTGCGATSASQVMKYHEWPDVGVGSNSVVFNDITYTVDFADRPFEWDLMLDSYQGQSTTEQKAAVANLMYCVGVAFNMQYGVATSGSFSRYTPVGLADYMKYDKGAHLEYRYFYGPMAWENLVYDELSTNGPVIYDGVSSEIGHSFVCDGYDGDGYFHFNWGWSGVSDGYFLLTSLNPELQGSGGGNKPYNMNQIIVRGLKKADPNADSDYVYMVGQLYPLYPSEKILELGRQTTFNAAKGTNGIINLSDRTVPSAEIAIECTPEEGDPIYLDIDDYENWENGGSIERFFVTFPTSMEAGNYTLRYVWRQIGGEWEYVKTSTYIPAYTSCKVENGKVYFDDVITTLECLDVDMADLTNLYRDEPWNFPVTFVNGFTEEISVNVCVAICQRKTMNPYLISDYEYVALQPGEKTEFTYSLPNNLPNGTYSFYVITDAGIILKRFDDVKVTATNGIDGLSVESEAEYYDLQGRKSKAATPGVYIKVTNDKIEKVVIRK